jgi:hypothetical protein
MQELSGTLEAVMQQLSSTLLERQQCSSRGSSREYNKSYFSYFSKNIYIHILRLWLLRQAWLNDFAGMRGHWSMFPGCLSVTSVPEISSASNALAFRWQNCMPTLG